MAEETTKKAAPEKLPATSIREALATPDNSVARKVANPEGTVVTPASADVMVDVQTLQSYYRDHWTSVEKPSTWLDAQIASGKMLVKAK